MKVLQVNCVYNTGSTGKIVYDVHTELKKQKIESVVCYGRGAKVSEEGVYKTCGELYSDINHLWANLSGVLYGGCFFSTRKLISVIKREKPDVVHLHCINGYFVNIYRLIAWLKKNDVKTLLTLHAEFMYTGGCGHAFECNQWNSPKGCGQAKCPRYRNDMHSWFFDRSATMWKRMKKAFEGFDKGLIITSVSPWLMSRAEESPILSGKSHRVVMNGADTEVFKPYGGESANKIKKELGIEEEKVVFHATPNFNDNKNNIKGGYYLLGLAKRMPQVKFVVAGPVTAEFEIPENVILLGRVSDQDRLAELYSMADLTLLTSRRETFSMVTAESLCCGTPVVGFKAGAPESICLEEYCRFTEYGNLNELQVAVNDMLNKEKDLGISEAAICKYKKENMGRDYIAVYDELVKL